MRPLSLSTSRAKALAAVITTAGAAVLFVGSASTSGAAGCAPTAHQPSPMFGSAYASATIPCSGTYQISLVNDAGSTLISTGQKSCSGFCNDQTVTVRCAGAYVHTFVWLNHGGVVTSDTSGHILC